jgi:Domain of unknown function (DUF1929)/Ricin-type beta-trefoil lectin domain-like/PKD domain
MNHPRLQHLCGGICRAVALLTISLGALGISSQMVIAQTASWAKTGQWVTLNYVMPINPIHIGLMHTGQVLIVAGSENDPNLHKIKSSKAAVWDLGGGNIANGKITRTKDLTWDVFCNGWAFFPDGRCFVIGGTQQYDPFHGEPRTTVFDPLVDRSDPASHAFVTMQNMAHGRWYATGIVVPDGRIMAFSGTDENGGINNNVEFYTVGSATKNTADGETGWSNPFSSPFVPTLYPWMHVLPDGRVFNSGGSATSNMMTINGAQAPSWQTGFAKTQTGLLRTYGNSVLLPLLPPNYDARVMILGGGNSSAGATATTEIIALPNGATSGSWVQMPDMPSGPRVEGNSVLLPSQGALPDPPNDQGNSDPTLFVQGGSRFDNNASTATLNADMFDPITNTWSSSKPGGAGTATYPRMYHSVALLLPDATVATAGSNPQRTVWDNHIEIHSPAYLFNADGSPATRPVITSVATTGGLQGQITYGDHFTVQTPNASNIDSVVLIKPGSDTHAFDMEQRLVGLPFTVAADNGSLSVTGPLNSNIAPPGYYMLFVVNKPVLNRPGVPSVATFVQVVPANQLGDQPPKGQIISPSGDVTITAGQSVPGGFVGTATDTDGSVQSYSWVFEEGTPDSSAAIQPGGSIVFPNTGTFSVSLTAVDDKGVNDPSPATLRVTVQSGPTPTPTPTPTPAVPQSGSTYHLICKTSGKALDNRGSTSNGTAVGQWTDGTTPNQEWKLVTDTTNNVYYNLICQTSGLALDNSGSTANGNYEKQYTARPGNPNQMWQLVNQPAGSGTYQLICKTGGVALDNRGSTSNGTVVGQWTPGTTTNQQWSFEFIR